MPYRYLINTCIMSDLVLGPIDAKYMSPSSHFLLSKSATKVFYLISFCYCFVHENITLKNQMTVGIRATVVRRRLSSRIFDYSLSKCVV